MALIVAALPAPAEAVTVTVGPPTIGVTNMPVGCVNLDPPCVRTLSQRSLADSGQTAVAPADGSVTVWRAAVSLNCEGFQTVRVLRPNGSELTGVGSSPPRQFGGVTTTALTSPLPIRAGDRIGVTVNGDACTLPGWGGKAYASIDVAAVGTPDILDLFGSAVPDGSSAVGQGANNTIMQLNADVVLDAPVITGLSPNSGRPEGGNTVTIDGDHFTGTSSVEFGGVPASGLTAVSDTQVRAVAPPHGAGPVDVTVTAAGGTSAPAGYTYAAAPLAEPPGGGTAAPPDGESADTTAPSLESFTLSRKVFVAANTGPSVVAAAAAGTVIAYRVSEPATTRFRVQRQLPGIRKGRRCVRGPRNLPRGAKPCKRHVSVRGSFVHVGAAGVNQFRFTGRVRGRTLRRGRYRLEAVATDAAGNTSPAERRRFRIVR